MSLRVPRRRLGGTLVALAAAASVLGLPSPAQASPIATVYVAGRTVFYRAAPGQVNALIIRQGQNWSDAVFDDVVAITALPDALAADAALRRMTFATTTPKEQ
jgi:hypothetical protein